MARLGKANAAVPEDILNFQYDSLACAAALGWDCLTIEEMPLTEETQGGYLVLNHDPAGTLRRIVTDVDPERFSAHWLETVARL